jgi:hypothetical protein
VSDLDPIPALSLILSSLPDDTPLQKALADALITLRAIARYRPETRAAIDDCARWMLRDLGLVDAELEEVRS